MAEFLCDTIPDKNFDMTVILRGHIPEDRVRAEAVTYAQRLFTQGLMSWSSYVEMVLEDAEAAAAVDINQMAVSYGLIWGEL